MTHYRKKQQKNTALILAHLLLILILSPNFQNQTSQHCKTKASNTEKTEK
jgi:hypothetical protein